MLFPCWLLTLAIGCLALALVGGGGISLTSRLWPWTKPYPLIHVLICSLAFKLMSSPSGANSDNCDASQSSGVTLPPRPPLCHFEPISSNFVVSIQGPCCIHSRPTEVGRRSFSFITEIYCHRVYLVCRSNLCLEDL